LTLFRTGDVRLAKYTGHIAFVDEIAKQTDYAAKTRTTKSLIASKPLNEKASKKYKIPDNAPAYAELYERGDGYKVIVKRR
jgi:hypothetical protein